MLSEQSPVLFHCIASSTLVALVLFGGAGCNGAAEPDVGSTVLGAAAQALTTDEEPSDYLYVGDNSLSSIKRWNIDTGECLGNFVPPLGNGPSGTSFRSPRGLLVSQGKLIAVAQNATLDDVTGEIHRFNREDGTFFDILTPRCATGTCPTPFGPRGAALLSLSPGITDDVLFVADIGDRTTFETMQARPGKVSRINARTGEVLEDLVTLRVLPGKDGLPGLATERAQAVVQGPDGMLYVSVFHVGSEGGHIVRVDPSVAPSTPEYVFDNPVDNVTGMAQQPKGLHRSGGLAFSPSGRLYVSSFRRAGSVLDDNDKILVFDCDAHGCTQDVSATIHLDLDSTPADERIFAQTIAFGPGEYLYAFMSDFNGAHVRYYDVHTKKYGILGACPNAADSNFFWHGTFGKSNPATLAYPNRQSKLPAPWMPALDQ